jgi:hypothetical protein
MTETITYEEATSIELPLNPFARHRIVKGLITELKMPGVDVSYIQLPLKGRRDLEEYATARQAALEVRAEEPASDFEVVFGTLRGSITVHPLIEGEI